MSLELKQCGIRRSAFLASATLFLVGTSLAQSLDLTDLTIEDLANVKVTSVSKKSESLSQAPGAIFVLTGEEVRRGGFTTLPESLRMVPGLYVAQVNPHQWQISARGFGDLQNNKMLVLVDGRGVYTPEFGGVYWDALDFPLEDVDRIEIIRGPGGTLWGANSVNGVINIVMKRSGQTPGAMVSTSADINQGYTATVQYGGQAGSKLDYRVYGKAAYLEPFNSPSGFPLPNNFNLSQAGLRVDWAASADDDISVEAGSYDGRFRFSPTPAGSAIALLKGNDILARWKHILSSRSSTDLLAYCDWYSRTVVTAEERNTCNVEFQDNFQYSARQSLIWGGSFLTTGDDLSHDTAPYLPEKRRNDVESGFAQYEYVVIPGSLRVVAGTKLEHNGYTRFEYQPQIRAVWTPGQTHSAWGSISRAIRSPARYESDLRLVEAAGLINGVPSFYDVAGNPNLESEQLKAYEAGYRYQPAKSFSVDTAIYYNDYTSLIIHPAAIPQFLSNQILLHITEINKGTAETHGLEVSANWKPIEYWTLSAALTETRGSPNAAEANPRHLFNAQSRVNLPHRLEFNSGLYHYGALPMQIVLGAAPSRGVSAFTHLDAGLSWNATPQWTLGIWARNLQSDKHVESLPTSTQGVGTEIPRSISFKIMWQQKPEGRSRTPTGKSAMMGAEDR